VAIRASSEVARKRRKQRQKEARANGVEPDDMGRVREGWHRMLTNLPAQGADTVFNLDHVDVGPTGLYVIETKTRRKSVEGTSSEDCYGGFNGQSLLWRRFDCASARFPLPERPVQGMSRGRPMPAWRDDRIRTGFPSASLGISGSFCFIPPCC